MGQKVRVLVRRAKRSKLPQPTDRLLLGTSGLEVSPFCLGMVGDDSPETVLAAFDAGINFFFVSTDMHWPLYDSLRVGLAELFRRGGGVRDEVVVVATSYVSPPVFLRAPFVELLEAIPGLDRIDVCAAGGCFVSDPPERRATMREHRASGFLGCRAVGASFHDRELVAPACNDETVDIAFVRFNPGHHGARDDVFPRLEASSTLLYGFKSLHGWAGAHRVAEGPAFPEGMWRPAPKDHYRFALSQPGLDGLLCAPQTPAQIDALARAMGESPLDPDEQDHMIDLALLATGRAELLPDTSDDPSSGSVRA